MRPIGQHQREILANQASWRRKPLLRAIYDSFYRRILTWIEPDAPGKIVEIGSGMGNLRSHCPAAICTDLFANPGLDLVCDGYELPFAAGSLSHLVLFDVFHHLEHPAAFLAEAHRVLAPRARLILFEPFISWTSHVIYGLLHHEPVLMHTPISPNAQPTRPRHYYAAQGNATRIFFQSECRPFLQGWRQVHAEAFSAFGYLLSGGFSKPALYPRGSLALMNRLDEFLSRWPRVFGGRCLIVLQPEKDQAPLAS